MRYVQVCFCAFLAGVLVTPVVAQEPLPDVTVILDFKAPHSQRSIKEMKREAGLILQSSGLKLGWALMGENPGATYNDLVVVSFHGNCQFQPDPPRADEPGPYGMTRVMNGEVLPFAEVDCNRVINAVRGAMSGTDFARGEEMVGRALGRVLAHELVHMLTRSVEHGQEGVEKPALSGRQLIEPVLPLSTFDIERLQQDRNLH